ncbi:MAG TPA: hypothetical protein DCY93_00860 [Firmicutes bacterium]|nr:hypothetical protein [Bacillota bacterium]
MNNILNTIFGISFIFICTTIGASLVFFLKGREISHKINQIIAGFAAGIMLAASFFSLILPALNKEVTYMPSYVAVGISIFLGIVFLYLIDKLTPMLQNKSDKKEKKHKLSKTSKMFIAVTIHNIPEGLAVGIAYGVALAAVSAKAENASSLMVGAFSIALGVGIQNIPEGTIVSLPILAETKSVKRAFSYGIISGIVEPISAVIGLFLAMTVEVIMPWALAFAAGCMIYVVFEEMVKEAQGDYTNHYGVFSFIVGFILMLILDTALS